MIPKYNTFIGFGELFTSAQQFYEECAAADIPLVITEANCKKLFYLLYARYGNTAIANFDPTQWKYRIFTTINSYGGEWQKKLDIQNKLQQLSLDSGDLFDAAKSIYNSASNPSTEPGTGTDTELSYINNQNVTKNKRAKTDAYAILWNMLDSNINEEFVSKFAPCFSKFARPNVGPVYVSDTDEFEED